VAGVFREPFHPLTGGLRANIDLCSEPEGRRRRHNGFLWDSGARSRQTLARRQIRDRPFFGIAVGDAPSPDAFPVAPQPWASYFFDYDGLFVDDAANSGHQGSVRTLTAPCGGATPTPLADGVGAAPPVVFSGGPDCQGPDCGCEGRDCQRRGILIVKKEVVDHSPLPIPSATTYPIQVDCGGFITNLALTNGGTGTIANIPYLTSCTVTEPPVTFNFCPKGWTPVWTQNIVTSPVQITAPVTTVTVVNTLTCDGRLIIKKEVVNRSEAIVPPSTTYPINVDCGGVISNLALPDNGSGTVNNIPDLTWCTVTEPSVTFNFCPKGWTPVWTQNIVTSPVQITAPVTIVTVVNTLTCKPQRGILIVEKNVENHSPLPIPPSTAYPIQVDCAGVITNMPLTDGGTQTVSNIPIGTNCTITEPLPTTNFCPRGEIPIWSQQFVPGAVTINGPTTSYTVVNILDCKRVIGDNTLTVVKRVEDKGPLPIAPTTTYQINVNCGGADTPMSLTNGGSQTVNNVPSGTSCTVSETPPTLNLCPPRLIPHWTTTYSPMSTLTVPPSATVVVLNVLTCEPSKVCVKPLVMNAAGECVCPPPTISGAGLNQCVCPQGQPMVDGTCVPILHVCNPPLVANAAGECGCPTGTHLLNGQCVKDTTTCKPPLVPNAAGECACPTGTQNVDGACVKIVGTCRPPLVMNGAGQCVAKPVACGIDMIPNGAGGCVCRPGLTMVRGVCRDVSQPAKPIPRCEPPARRNNQGQCVAPSVPRHDDLPPRLDDARQRSPMHDGPVFPPH
jgi:hypothetical protein